jgi:type II secretory pathway component GspD/PulD (secretin)
VTDPLSTTRTLAIALVLAVLAAGSGLVLAADLQIRVIELKHRSADDLIPVVRPLLGIDGAVSGDGQRLIVRDESATLDDIERVVRAIDVPRRNLRITVRQTTAEDVRRGGAGPSQEGGARIVRRYSTGQGAFEQHLQVLDGETAYIEIGKSIPDTTLFVELAGPHLQLAQGVVYREVTTGFAVSPRLHGEEVELAISPRLSFVTDRGMQIVEFHEMASRVRVRLGEWVDIGGTMNGADVVSQNILRTWRTGSNASRTVLLRVDPTEP